MPGRLMEFAARPCPVCGSTDDSGVLAESSFDAGQLDRVSFSSRKLPDYRHHRLIVCPVCDALYASPAPKPGQLAQAYHEAGFDTSEESHFAARTYAALLPEIIRHLPDLAAAIDIGTGDGAFLEQLLSRGFASVVGVEPSTAPVAAAKEAIRPLIAHGLFDPKNFPAESFSLATCFQTLEHLHDPKEFCADAYGLLKRGGAVLFVCHNRRSMSAALLGMKSPIMDIEHLQLLSPKSVKGLLERAGFRGVKVRAVFNRYPLHYWLKLFPLPPGLKERLLALLKGSGLGAIPISIPAGNMAVVGYK